MQVLALVETIGFGLDAHLSQVLLVLSQFVQGLESMRLGHG